MNIIERKNSRLVMEIPYFQVPNSIFDSEDIKLDIYEKMTYLYLCRCGNQGADIFPSYDTIAQKCGMGRRKAIYCVNSLIECGLLEKERRKEPGKKKNLTNVYYLNDPSAYHAPLDSACDALPSACDAPPIVHDMHQGSACDAPKKELYKKNNIKKNHTRTPKVENKSPFHDFPQREYDYDDLENKLLGWGE